MAKPPTNDNGPTPATGGNAAAAGKESEAFEDFLRKNPTVVLSLLTGAVALCGILNEKFFFDVFDVPYVQYLRTADFLGISVKYIPFVLAVFIGVVGFCILAVIAIYLIRIGDDFRAAAWAASMSRLAVMAPALDRVLLHAFLPILAALSRLRPDRLFRRRSSAPRPRVQRMLDALRSRERLYFRARRALAPAKIEEFDARIRALPGELLDRLTAFLDWIKGNAFGVFVAVVLLIAVLGVVLKIFSADVIRDRLHTTPAPNVVEAAGPGTEDGVFAWVGRAALWLVSVPGSIFDYFFVNPYLAPVSIVLDGDPGYLENLTILGATGSHSFFYRPAGSKIPGTSDSVTAFDEVIVLPSDDIRAVALAPELPVSFQPSGRRRPGPPGPDLVGPLLGYLEQSVAALSELSGTARAISEGLAKIEAKLEFPGMVNYAAELENLRMALVGISTAVQELELEPQGGPDEEGLREISAQLTRIAAALEADLLPTALTLADIRRDLKAATTLLGLLGARLQPSEVATQLTAIEGQLKRVVTALESDAEAREAQMAALAGGLDKIAEALGPQLAAQLKLVTRIEALLGRIESIAIEIRAPEAFAAIPDKLTAMQASLTAILALLEDGMLPSGDEITSLVNALNVTNTELSSFDLDTHWTNLMGFVTAINNNVAKISVSFEDGDGPEMPSLDPLLTAIEEASETLTSIDDYLKSLELENRSAGLPPMIALVSHIVGDPSPIPRECYIGRFEGIEFRFAKNSYSLDSDGTVGTGGAKVAIADYNRDMLEKAVDRLKEKSQGFGSGDYLLVVGHADISGSIDLNDKLSELRAHETLTRLQRALEDEGTAAIDLIRVARPIGLGEAAHAMSKDPGDEGNRRVLLYLCQPGKQANASD